MIWQARKITDTTLVGYIDLHEDELIPIGDGNCFSVLASFWGVFYRNYKILNIGLEDLEKWMRLTNTSFPIKIKPLDKRHAVIIDERIPNNWFSKDTYCELCSPHHLLPKLQIEKDYQLKLDKGLIALVLHPKYQKPFSEKYSGKMKVYYNRCLEEDTVMIIECNDPEDKEPNIVFGVYTEMSAGIEYPEFYKKKELL